MRDDILSGEREVSDENLVRATNDVIRAMKVLEQRKAQQTATTDDDWQTGLWNIVIGESRFTLAGAGDSTCQKP